MFSLNTKDFETNTTKYFKDIQDRATDFSSNKDNLKKLIQTDIESRKTKDDSDTGSDQTATSDFSVEDSARLKDYRPIFDYESSEDNPLLKLDPQNQLSAASAIDIDIKPLDNGFTVEARSSDNIDTSAAIDTPALDQKVNDYLADWIINGDNAKLDQYNK